MKKCSTAHLLYSCLALAAGAGVQAQPVVVVSAPLADYRRSPQVRALQPWPAVARDVGWPRAIVLDAGEDASALVRGPAQASGGLDATTGPARLLTAGQLVRLEPAVGVRDRHLQLYRPGPLLTTGDGHARGRLAWRVGSLNVMPGQDDAGSVTARIARAGSEVVAGDLALEAARLQPAVDGTPVTDGVTARVAVQHGAGRARFAGAGQVTALDRGAQDGVRVGMCLRAGSCLAGSGTASGERNRIEGRVVHVGAHASAVQLLRTLRPLMADDAVCIAACEDAHAVVPPSPVAGGE